MPATKEINEVKAESIVKQSYATPKIVDYGKVVELTRKPGSRTDGSTGSKGDRGA